MPADEETARAERVPLSRPSVEQVYRQHGETVARWALRLGGPRFDAADAVQEVFVVVAKRLPSFRGDSTMATWLYGITENVVYRQRRRERVWFELRGKMRRQGPLVSRPLTEGIERAQASELVYGALDRMREPYRTALILFELEGLSGQEIATLKGCKVATVWVWLHRGRAAFLRHLTALAKPLRGRS